MFSDEGDRKRIESAVQSTVTRKQLWLIVAPAILFLATSVVFYALEVAHLMDTGVAGIGGMMLIAMFLYVSAVRVIDRYCVVDPLLREIGRLREDLVELKARVTNERSPEEAC